MPRITKDPEERRKEILDTAEELFMKNGYENTAISDIVKTLGVAQGTFYYYFKSKNEIVNAILERFMDTLFRNSISILQEPGLNSKDKIQNIVRALLSLSRDRGELVLFMHDKKNELIHYRIAQKYIESFFPVMSSLVRQGLSEGLFEMEYPDGVTRILLTGIMQYLHDDNDIFTNEAKLMERMKTMEYLMNKVFGVKGQGFSFS